MNIKNIERKKKKEEIEIEDKAIEAVTAYLKSRGWKLLVGGFQNIEQGSLKYNFRLIFGFTGRHQKIK